jgi:hypothetical protein
VQKLFGCGKTTVSTAVWVTGLRRSRWWWSWMCRSWAGLVTHGLRLWGRLGTLPCFLKWSWRLFIVEKLTFNSLTAVMDFLPVIMTIASSLNLRHLWHCALWQNCTF